MAATRATPKPVSRGDVAALVITFFPDRGIAERVKHLFEQFDRVALIDNGSDETSLEPLSAFRERRGFSLHQNNSNMGVATALNQGISSLADEGFGWVVTFDQDSQIRPGFLAAQLTTLAAQASPHTVALIGANRINPDGDVPHRWLRPRKTFPFFERVECEQASKGVTLVITSGTLTNVNVFKRLGGFREELFIDMVDTEYCLRARERRYFIPVSDAAELSHKVGDLTRSNLMGITVSSTHHSPLRRYYLFRNSVYLIRRYGRVHPHWLVYQLLALVEVILGIIVSETEKLAKLRACVLGFSDGIAKKSGPSTNGAIS